MTQTKKDRDAIESTMYYLEKTPLYDTEKPYTMRYKPEEEIPQTNFKKCERPMTARSMRAPGSGPFRFEECGFQLVEFHSKMSYDDFWDSDKTQDVYIQEVRETIKKALGAKFVWVLDYAVRRRHASFPVSTGENYQYDQPTALAHVDFTKEEGERIIRILFGDRADDVLRGRWQAVNLWKPIKGPLNDWPLGLCDTRSVDYPQDTIAGDVVFDGFVTENLQVVHNSNFEWYYLPDHETWEALIFKSGDSEEGATPGTPHSGFYNPHASKVELRESLDCRCFAFFEDLEPYPPIVDHSVAPPNV